MAMRDTIRTYKEAAGKVVQQIESFQEHGELGVMGATVEINFTDGSRIDFYVSARTEITAEIVPARKKPQRVRATQKSRGATAN